MNPRHPAWWLLPMVGILAGLLFRPSEEGIVIPPITRGVQVRTLFFPTGEAIRFLKGPDMQVWLSEAELSAPWLSILRKTHPGFMDAQEACKQLSERTGERLRLPTLIEWRQAARAGIKNLPTPWGYDPTPPENLLFAKQEKPSTSGPAFGYGFRDLAGGTWEWTQEGVLMGGAWSETNPETLHIDYTWDPPEGYGDADTGIRLVWVE